MLYRNFAETVLCSALTSKQRLWKSQITIFWIDRFCHEEYLRRNLVMFILTDQKRKSGFVQISFEESQILGPASSMCVVNPCEMILVVSRKVNMPVRWNRHCVGHFPQLSVMVYHVNFTPLWKSSISPLRYLHHTVV